MIIDIFTTTNKYKEIYADPCWNYRVWSKKGKGRSAENHYPTMTLQDIMALPVNRIADKDCVLFMWATYPNLREAFAVLDAWGFTYKTVAFTWIKLNKNSLIYKMLFTLEMFIKSLFVGLGYYTRANPEICLLATKGKPLPRQSRSVRNIIIAPIREHSRKPDEAREKIVQLMGDLPRIELFSRQQFDGWDSWGNETDKFNLEKVG